MKNVRLRVPTSESAVELYGAVIERAVDRGVTEYIASRRGMVPDFIRRNYSFKGALRLHKKAFGLDLVKVPLNILWQVLTAMVATLAWMLRKVGARRIANWLDRIPPGMETSVEHEVKWLLFSELLELPFKQKSRDTSKDALLLAILRQKSLENVLTEYTTEIERKRLDPLFKTRLEKNSKNMVRHALRLPILPAISS